MGQGGRGGHSRSYGVAIARLCHLTILSGLMICLIVVRPTIALENPPELLPTYAASSRLTDQFARTPSDRQGPSNSQPQSVPLYPYS
ncbi:MAG: hypothetical protein AAF152_21230, partial [Cyanobacteria bacterium P01_A01_bin.114]